MRGVVSSRYSNDPVVSMYRSYGFSDSIPKPYRIDELVKMLTRIGLY